MADRGRPKPPLTLSPDERAALEDLAARDGAHPLVALRARIVLRSADGHTNREVAAALDVTPATVGKWRARYLRLGREGLRDAPRPGGPRKVTDADVERILWLTRATRPVGGGRWSTRRLARHVGLSSATISRIWRAHAVEV